MKNLVISGSSESSAVYLEIIRFISSDITPNRIFPTHLDRSIKTGVFIREKSARPHHSCSVCFSHQIKLIHPHQILLMVSVAMRNHPAMKVPVHSVTTTTLRVLQLAFSRPHSPRFSLHSPRRWRWQVMGKSPNERWRNNGNI